MKTFYRQRLPHIQPVGACFFITFRLFGSVSRKTLTKHMVSYNDELAFISRISDENLRKEKLACLRHTYFRLYDLLLHETNTGPKYLSNEKIAEIVKEELFRWDGKLYELLSYTIMSNHIHLIIDTSIQLNNHKTANEFGKEYIQLDKILKRLKGVTAIRANRALSRNGQFWQRESWDVIIRDQKMLLNVIGYTLENPVKAGMVTNWQDFKWSYWKNYI